MKKRRESILTKGSRSRSERFAGEESVAGAVDLHAYRIKKKLHAEGFHLGINGSGKLALLMRIGH